MRTIALCTLALAACGHARPPVAPSSGPRVTEPFRQEHAELLAHLDHVDALAGELAKLPPEERRAAQEKVLAFYAEHLVPHAAWEEEVLYPAVDRRASQGEPFTASMRYEHTVVKAWVDQLRARLDDPDPAAFVRQADRLLGLVSAHFQAEEHVLLPVLDQTMTPEEYERELGHGHHQETP
jgi:hemerythrin-like domain-containing protein